MLTRLNISNIALIDKSDIVFDAGFSALTGETGAGKSILIESVAFVLGERASRENIRTGADKATVDRPLCRGHLFMTSWGVPPSSYITHQDLTGCIGFASA